MARTQHPNVYLDLSHLDAGVHPQAVPRHRPALPRLRPGHHPRPDPGPPRRPLHDRRRDGRRPTAGRRLPGLWAAGEVIQLGPARGQPAGVEQPARRARLRGPGRRGHRRRARPSRALAARSPADRRRPPAGDGRAPIDLADIRNSLRALMWRRMGITRDAAGLAEAADAGRLLVPLRPAPRLRRPRRLDPAEHAHRRPR